MYLLQELIILAQQKQCSWEKRNSKGSIQKDDWGRGLRYDTDFVPRQQSLKFSLSNSYTLTIPLLPSPCFGFPACMLPDLICLWGGQQALIEVCLWYQSWASARLPLFSFQPACQVAHSHCSLLPLCAEITIKRNCDCEGHTKIESNPAKALLDSVYLLNRSQAIVSP